MAFTSLTGLSDTERDQALKRYDLIRPFLDERVPLTHVARAHGLALRTARRWVDCYRRAGLAGLVRKPRSDRQKRTISDTLRKAIEGLALKRPRLSVAAIHRQAASIAAQLGEAPPCYGTTYSLVQGLAPAMVTLAQEGTKAYADTFDLVHRHEANGPNAIWQADHTQLDIWLKDESGRPRKPWLTVVLDDYSRAIAGYALYFAAPSAIQTALALRQAIWRKVQPRWQICGIPETLYSDHGSDFTSRHLEQVAADLKINLIHSRVGRPRGRGKIERFFETVTQILLSRLPGYAPAGTPPAPVLTFAGLAGELERYLVGEYHIEPHSTTGFPPQARWEAEGFLPRMPESLEQLDLLLLTVVKPRRVHADGIRFQGMRYIAPTLAAYVGEDVLLRYDPRDVAEVRVFHKDRFVCRAVCQELAGEVVPLREIIRARERRRRDLRRTIQERKAVVETFLEVRRGEVSEPTAQSPAETTPEPRQPKRTLKRYANE